MWDEVLSVDTNSLIHLLRRSSKNCGLLFANSTIFKENYSTYMSPRYDKEVTPIKSFPPIVILFALPAFLESMYMTINCEGLNSLNATKIALMKGVHWRMRMVVPELLFSIYKCGFFCGLFAPRWLHKAQPTLPRGGFGGKAAGPEIAPPCVFYGHDCIEVRCIGSGMASSASRYCRKGH